MQAGDSLENIINHPRQSVDLSTADASQGKSGSGAPQPEKKEANPEPEKRPHRHRSRSLTRLRTSSAPSPVKSQEKPSEKAEEKLNLDIAKVPERSRGRSPAVVAEVPPPKMPVLPDCLAPGQEGSQSSESCSGSKSASNSNSSGTEEVRSTGSVEDELKPKKLPVPYLITPHSRF